MKLKFLILLFTLSFWPFSGYSDPELPPNVLKEIMKITSQGWEPKELRLNKRDASVFFVNMDEKREYSLAINYGPRRMHCASSELVLGEDLWLRTVKPIQFKDFSISCFPDIGIYDIHARSGKVFWSGKIVVD